MRVREREKVTHLTLCLSRGRVALQQILNDFLIAMDRCVMERGEATLIERGRGNEGNRPAERAGNSVSKREKERERVKKIR